MSELNRVAPETGGGASSSLYPPDSADGQSPRRRKKKASHYPYEEHDYGAPYKFEPNFKGPTRKRGCTDVLCLVLFLVFLGCWIFVGYFAWREGDISKVHGSIVRVMFEVFVRFDRCFLTFSVQKRGLLAICAGAFNIC